MVFTCDHLAKHSLGFDSIEVQNDGKLEIKDERNMIISSNFPQIDQVLVIFDRD